MLWRLDLRITLVVCELLFVVQGHDTAVGEVGSRKDQ
jgi:hypothetical protein